MIASIGDNGGMSEILLATLNARYSHASLGLRYLRANLGALRERGKMGRQKTQT